MGLIEHGLNVFLNLHNLGSSRMSRRVDLAGMYEPMNVLRPPKFSALYPACNGLWKRFPGASRVLSNESWRSGQYLERLPVRHRRKLGAGMERVFPVREIRYRLAGPRNTEDFNLARFLTLSNRYLVSDLYIHPVYFHFPKAETLSVEVGTQRIQDIRGADRCPEESLACSCNAWQPQALFYVVQRRGALLDSLQQLAKSVPCVGDRKDIRQDLALGSEDETIMFIF